MDFVINVDKLNEMWKNIDYEITKDSNLMLYVICSNFPNNKVKCQLILQVEMEYVRKS